MANVKKKCVISELALTLNLEEAQVLRSILDKIGGLPNRYPRAVAENINTALSEAGIEAAALECDPDNNRIYFK